MEKEYVLEITLISGQGLQVPSHQLRGATQTYAVAWVQPSVKLRTCTDSDGGENPTWNDKFLFKVSSQFLSSETSGVCIEIFAVGVIRDTLVGSVRFLVSNFLPSGYSAFKAGMMKNHTNTPSFNAVQVRRPSGRFHGVLNIGATVLDAADVPALATVPAIGFRDLIKEGSSRVHRRARRNMKKSNSTVLISRENNNNNNESNESDDSDLTTHSSTAASTALRDWNEMMRGLEGNNNHVRSSSEGGRLLLCGLASSPRKAACFGTLMFSQSFSNRKTASKQQSKNIPSNKE